MGWLDEGGMVIGFMHKVTVCGGWVLDGTARQFNSTLPAAWVASPEHYVAELAQE
ncbi:hypothetical protein IU468_28715 [Nocardia farcinica]|uniref:hypothetical protein n=1 Tax=Nocardia farcinica TaxID=37329 RepID=UPI0018939839|nr:hypothetical protein [Nocardia farcinica]MBF6260240.1 hypothetical protein [Nocardia farcinica]